MMCKPKIGFIFEPRTMIKLTFHSSFCLWKSNIETLCLQVGQGHHFTVAKISKPNLLKTTDLIQINLFRVTHFSSSATCSQPGSSISEI